MVFPWSPRGLSVVPLRSQACLRWPSATSKEAIMCGRYVLETDLSIICLMQLWGS